MLQKSIILFMGILFVMTTTQACFYVKTVTRERIDLELDGNQGYLAGESIPAQGEPKKKTKTFIKFEIDLSEFQEYGPPKEEREGAIEQIETEELDEGAQMSPGVFNKGFIVAKETQVPELTYIHTEEYSDIDLIEEPEKEPSFTIYTVKEDETLWDIAARSEIYGNPTKWTVIYEANRDKIKKPSLIKPGMKLKIPR